jgi:maltose-binding protein MalE
MKALATGVPYPINVDEDILKVYWRELDIAIQSVFEGEASPAEALQKASDNITRTLNNQQALP